MSSDPNTSPVILTQLLHKKEKVPDNFIVASKESQKANKRTKKFFLQCYKLYNVEL